MAIVRAQVITGFNASAALSATATFGSTPAATSLIVVSVGINSATATVTSVTATGSAGGTLVARVTRSVGEGHEMWWLTGMTGTVVTVNLSASGDATIVMAEYTGAATVSPVDGTPGTHEAGGAAALALPTGGGTITPSAAGALIVASCSDDQPTNAATWTHADVGGTYLEIGHTRSTASIQNIVGYSLIQTTATATSIAITNSNGSAATNDGIIAIFKAAAVASVFPLQPHVWHNPLIPQ